MTGSIAHLLGICYRDVLTAKRDFRNTASLYNSNVTMNPNFNQCLILSKYSELERSDNEIKESYRIIE
jgi:hypothetical protein